MRLLRTTLCCLDHRDYWAGSWFKWPDIALSGDDVGRWPFSTVVLVKLAAFLSSLSWPSEVTDLGPGGVSYVELLILYERCAGERLRIEERKLMMLVKTLQIDVGAVGGC